MWSVPLNGEVKRGSSLDIVNISLKFMGEILYKKSSNEPLSLINNIIRTFQKDLQTNKKLSFTLKGKNARGRKKVNMLLVQSFSK